MWNEGASTLTEEEQARLQTWYDSVLGPAKQKLTGIPSDARTLVLC